jgi:O-antigen ligase
MKEDLTKNDAVNNLLEPRAVRWASAKELMLASPVYGYGSGSEIPLLKEVYYEHKLYNSYLNSLNIHNQYLSMVIKTGAIGLLVLLFVLFTGFKRSIQWKDGLFCAFLTISFHRFFSENVLDGNKGIFFFRLLLFTVLYQKKGPGDQQRLIQK